MQSPLSVRLLCAITVSCKIIVNLAYDRLAELQKQAGLNKATLEIYSGISYTFSLLSCDLVTQVQILCKITELFYLLMLEV